MRTACLLVPDLPLAAERRAHPALRGQPLVVASAAGPRAEVVSVSREAAQRGICRGSTIAQARSVCATLCVRIASPALEQAARDALCDVARSFSPRVAPVPRAVGAFGTEAAVWLDASGIASLFPGEAGFATALVERARRLGLPANVAVAGSRQVAHLAARGLSGRGGETRVIAPGGEAAFLAPLPIELLTPDHALAEALTRFGLHTLGALCRLPRRALAARLGPQALALAALARGEGEDPPLPEPEDTRLVEALDLEHPVEQLEPLRFVLQGLLSRLLARLALRHLGCAALALELGLEEGRRDQRRIGVAAPTDDLRVLLRLLNTGLEARLPEAAVVAVRLETVGEPLRGDQLDLFRPAGPPPRTLGRVLAELASLCGSDRVGAPRVADDHHPDVLQLARFAPRADATHAPESLTPDGRPLAHTAPRADATRALESLTPDGRPLAHAAPRAAATPHAAATPGACAPAPPAALALRSLRPPLAAQVRTRGGQPVSIRSALANGDVVRCAGPWRTTGGWWSREGRFAFDHFDVWIRDGTVARLRYDHLARAWQIDALYD